MSIKMEHLIEFSDLAAGEWEELYQLYRDIREHPADYAETCRGKIMATLFYEPSTRTQLSFQAAMMRLGGKILGFSDPDKSSVAKGESLRDTVKIVSSYTDLIVMRHPVEGAAAAAALYAGVPVINAGDGGHMHPTQTLTDLTTIYNEKGTLSGLTVGICGDLLNGRTVHSLLQALSSFPGNRFYMISTDYLRLPAEIKAMVRLSGSSIYEVKTLEECLKELDILYMTRIQKERFSSAAAYAREAGIYVLTGDKMKLAKKDMIILHPLPKVDEITPEVDEDPRALYFKQAENGMYIRMALILRMCETGRKLSDYTVRETRFGMREEDGRRCKNPRCITQYEKYFPALKKHMCGSDCCAYCGQAWPVSDELKNGNTR